MPTSEPRWFRLLNLIFLPVGAFICLVPDNGFAWILGTFFAALFAFQLVEHSRYLSVPSRARSLMLGALCLTSGVRFLIWYTLHGQPFWVLAFIGLALSFPLCTWLINLVQPACGKEFLIRASTCCGLFLLYVLLRPGAPVLQGLLLLFAAHDPYQVAFLLGKDDPPSATTFRRYYALGGTVGLLAVLGSAYNLEPLFHVIVVILVGNTIGIAFQTTLEGKQDSLQMNQERLLIYSKKPEEFLRTIKNCISCCPDRRNVGSHGRRRL